MWVFFLLCTINPRCPYTQLYHAEFSPACCPFTVAGAQPSCCNAAFFTATRFFHLLYFWWKIKQLNWTVKIKCSTESCANLPKTRFLRPHLFSTPIVHGWSTPVMSTPKIRSISKQVGHIRFQPFTLPPSCLVLANMDFIGFMCLKWPIDHTSPIYFTRAGSATTLLCI